VARTHDGRDTRRLRGLLWASGGPLAGAEGLLNLPAGDLIAAGNAVGVGREQDPHAVPGAGGDFGGRGTGGQPQRQRGMTQVVRAAHRLGPCPVFRGGSGAGLVPDPGVEAFAERAAASAAEQPPVCSVPEGSQVPVQEAGELRGDRDCPDGTVGRCNGSLKDLSTTVTNGPGVAFP
jgi:hypothetical protein